MNTEEKSMENNEKKTDRNEYAPGLGVATMNPPTTSTYKRAQARKKRKFDAWWYGNHPDWKK